MAISNVQDIDIAILSMSFLPDIETQEFTETKRIGY